MNVEEDDEIKSAHHLSTFCIYFFVFICTSLLANFMLVIAKLAWKKLIHLVFHNESVRLYLLTPSSFENTCILILFTPSSFEITCILILFTLSICHPISLALGVVCPALATLPMESDLLFASVICFWFVFFLHAQQMSNTLCIYYLSKLM